jgi:hypothetical protein
MAATAAAVVVVDIMSGGLHFPLWVLRKPQLLALVAQQLQRQTQTGTLVEPLLSGR